MAGKPVTSPLLSVKDLMVGVQAHDGSAPILRGVSLDVDQGEIVGIVGESGAGKSVFGTSVMGLLDAPTKVTHGEVRLDGIDLRALNEAGLRQVRGKHLAMVFQDPMTTLSPTHRVGTLLIDIIRAHAEVSRTEARKMAAAALKEVGIPSALERLDAHPHQLSGGMRQRVCIAAALLHNPQLVIADEPTTALDVTTQAQILSLVRQRREHSGTGFIWITHDLGVVAELADRVAVMYAGLVVEQGTTRSLLNSPRHPYTRALLGSIPARNRGQARLPQVAGIAPRPGQVGMGCAFAPRCSRVMAACHEVAPELLGTVGGAAVRCMNPLPTDGAQ